MGRTSQTHQLKFSLIWSTHIVTSFVLPRLLLTGNALVNGWTRGILLLPNCGSIHEHISLYCNRRLGDIFGRSSLQLLWASTISTQRELRDCHPQTPPIQQGSIAREMNLNNTMAASASAPVSIGPVVVVGSQFCAPYAVPLTITKKALSLSDSDFAVTDANGNVVLKVQGVFLSVRERCVLVDAAGAPLLTMQRKMFSMHGRWQVFRGDSTDAKDLVFTVKKSSVFQLKTQLDVIMAGNPNQEACDFKIKGSYFERSCTICVGNSGSIIAQMSRQYTVKNVLLGKDTFGVTVSPNVDYAFVAALIVVLDEINKSESGEA